MVDSIDGKNNVYSRLGILLAIHSAFSCLWNMDLTDWYSDHQALGICRSANEDHADENPNGT